MKKHLYPSPFGPPHPSEHAVIDPIRDESSLVLPATVVHTELVHERHEQLRVDHILLEFELCLIRLHEAFGCELEVPLPGVLSVLQPSRGLGQDVATERTVEGTDAVQYQSERSDGAATHIVHDGPYHRGGYVCMRP